MRQWQRSTVCAAFLAVFLLGVWRPAMSHEGDITLAELREQPGAEYQLRIELPNELAGSVLTPQLPSRCSLSPDRAPDPEHASTILQFAFTCDGQPLTGHESLDLPWPTVGGVVTAYWEDGSSRSQFFTGGDAGVTVLLEPLQGVDTHWGPQLRQDAIAGFGHVFMAWPHLLFLISLALWARAQRLVHLITAFMIGGVLAAVIAGGAGVTLPLLATEMGLIGTAAVLALMGSRQQSVVVAKWHLLPFAVLGLLHGLGWASVLSQEGVVGWPLGARLLVVNLGIDAAQVLLALAMTGAATLGRRLPSDSRWQQGLGYGLAGLAVVAIALPQSYQGQSLLGVVPTANPTRPQSGDENAIVSSSDSSEVSTTTAVAVGTATRPAATTSPNASETPAAAAIEGEQALPIQSFVAINPFEVRSEVLVDVSTLLASGVIANPPTVTTLPVEVQATFKQEIAQAVRDGLTLMIDGRPAELTLDQVNFVTAEEAGIVMRESPMPELLDEATLGMVWLSPVSEIPQSIAVEWALFTPAIPQIATTITDPQRSEEQILTPEQAIADWENTLVDVAVPNIEAIDVSATSRKIPLASLALVLIAVWVDRRGLIPQQKQQRSLLAATRTVLPLAVWMYPIAAMPLTLPPPFQPQPSSTQTALILERLLGNIYQSFEFRTEEEIYDNLAISVEGEQLTDIYLENRRALEVENRGGARARVDQIEVTEISSIHSASGKQLLVQAEWRVGGSVSHFGHTHYRHNLYVAAVTLSYVDSVWKIQRIDVIDEHRLL